MRAVNLLPEQARQEGRQILTTTSAGLGGGILVLFALVFVTVSFWQGHSNVSDREGRLASLEQQVEEIQAETARSAAERGNDQARVTAFRTVAASRFAWDDLLDDLSRVLPSGSWLTSVNMQTGAAPDGASATASAPTAFVATGIATSQNTVALVMKRLDLVPSLTNVTLQQSTRTQIGTIDAFQFTVSANITPTEVQS